MNKGLAAILAGSVAVAMAGMNAVDAVAADSCTDGTVAGTSAAQSAFSLVPRPTTGPRDPFETTFMFGRASGVQGGFDSEQRSLAWANTTPEVTASAPYGPAMVALGTQTVDGVTVTGQTLSATATATAAYAGTTVNEVTGPAGAGYFADPNASRTTLNADGDALATSITDALPNVRAALAADTSPAAAAFIVALESAKAAAPFAGTSVVDGPSLVVDRLDMAFDATLTGATATVSAARFTIGGVMSATGYGASSSIDLVAGEGVNGRTTLTPSAWTILGVPVTATGGSSQAAAVDVSSLDAAEQASVTAALGRVRANILQLVGDGGLMFVVRRPGAVLGGAAAITPLMVGYLGDLPSVFPGGTPGTAFATIGGSSVNTQCMFAPVGPDPTPTDTPDPTPDPTATATPDPTATATPDPTPSITPTPPVKADLPVKQAPPATVVTTDTPPDG